MKIALTIRPVIQTQYYIICLLFCRINANILWGEPSNTIFSPRTVAGVTLMLCIVQVDSHSYLLYIRPDKSKVTFDISLSRPLFLVSIVQRICVYDDIYLIKSSEATSL